MTSQTSRTHARKTFPTAHQPVPPLRIRAGRAASASPGTDPYHRIHLVPAPRAQAPAPVRQPAPRWSEPDRLRGEMLRRKSLGAAVLFAPALYLGHALVQWVQSF